MLWHLDTPDNKFWSALPSTVKFDFFITYVMWNNPQITPGDSQDKSKINCMFAYAKFSNADQFQIIKFYNKLNMMK